LHPEENLAVVVQKVSGTAKSVRAIGAPEDFSLILGGPLFQLLRRTHLFVRRRSAKRW